MQSRKRWIYIIALVLLLWTLTFTLFWHFARTDTDSKFPSWLGIAITASLFIGSQVIFVIPLCSAPRSTTKGTSLKWSICIAGLLASVLTIALGMLLSTLVLSFILNTPEYDYWGNLAYIELGWWTAEVDPSQLWEFNPFTISALVLILSWVIWSALLWVYVRRRHRDPNKLVRITGWLFAGSLIELLLSIPLTIMVNRRTDCYCEAGSFGTLILSITACLWLLGPGIVIVIFWRKRPWIKDHCIKCGYPRKVASATVCSECGVGF